MTGQTSAGAAACRSSRGSPFAGSSRAAIDHAPRFTALRNSRAYIYAARHVAPNHADPALPPMGLRGRLEHDAKLRRLGP